MPRPVWFAVAVVARDLVIVGGVLAYRVAFGRIETAHSAVSKLNTALLFTLLSRLLAARAGMVPAGPWLPALQFATLATIVASAADYVLVWGRKAWRGRGRRPRRD